MSKDRGSLISKFRIYSIKSINQFSDSSYQEHLSSKQSKADKRKRDEKEDCLDVTESSTKKRRTEHSNNPMDLKKQPEDVNKSTSEEHSDKFDNYYLVKKSDLFYPDYEYKVLAKPRISLKQEPNLSDWKSSLKKEDKKKFHLI